MGYTDDWESLMNGVFGPGGKLRYDVQKPPEKTGLPDLNAALLEQQKKLDEMLKKQNAALRGGTAQETLAQSRMMLGRTPSWTGACGPCAAPLCGGQNRRRLGTSSSSAVHRARGGTSPSPRRPAAWPRGGF